MKKLALTFVIVALLFAVVSMPGCNNSRKIPKDFDYGNWTGTTYRNDFFGFSITVPEGWYIGGKEEIKAVIDESKGMIDNKELQKQLKIAEITTANLFFTSQYTEEEALEKEASNPNIVLIVENLSAGKRQIDRAQFANSYRQNLSKAVPGLVVKSQTEKSIGGQEFTSLQLQFTMNDTLIFQEHLVCVKNGFAVTFGLTTLDDSEKPLLDDIMATLKWD